MLQKETEGWDDFDIDDTELTMPQPATAKSNVPDKTETKIERTDNTKESQESQDTGWDQFDDWGQDVMSLQKV